MSTRKQGTDAMKIMNEERDKQIKQYLRVALNLMENVEVQSKFEKMLQNGYCGCFDDIISPNDIEMGW